MRHTIFEGYNRARKSFCSRCLTSEVSGSLFHLAAVWGTI